MSPNLKQILPPLIPNHESDNSSHAPSIALKYKRGLLHVALKHNQEQSIKHHYKPQIQQALPIKTTPEQK